MNIGVYVNVAVICCPVTYFKQHSAWALWAGMTEQQHTQYDIINIMKYVIMNYAVMKYDVMKYDIMKYQHVMS